MSRERKQVIELNDNESLRNVLQEVYNNTCTQIRDAQKVINEITAATEPEDVEDHVKLAKAKTDALKLKETAIKTKLDIGRLQNDIIKHSGDIMASAMTNPEVVNKDSFAKVRELIEANKAKN